MNPRGSRKLRARACLGSLVVATILVVAGCFTAENSERRQLAALEKGIESDRFAVDRSTPRVEEQVEPDGRESAARKALASSAVPVVERVDDDESADTAPRTVIKIWGKSMPSVEVVPAAVPAKEAPGVGSVSNLTSSTVPRVSSEAAQKSYDLALSLVNAHAYDKGAGALGVFLLEWPSDPNASNATYWQGECYFAMGEYAHASELFEQALERFPRSTRAPDCLLKLGLCQQKLGDAAKAKTYFERLGSEYPKSEAVRRIPTGT
jgi:tol-pal system protein YbgF